MDGNEQLVGTTTRPEGAGNSGVTSMKDPRRGAFRTRLYRDGQLMEENFPVEQISEQLTQRHGCAIWLDLCGPDSDQLAIIGREFGLHKLAIEDAVEETQRPKIDRYPTHLFMSAYSAALDGDTGELVAREIPCSSPTTP